MAKILAAAVFLLCFSAAFARKCNICTSTTSLEDCDKTKQEQTCPAGYDYCATLSMKFTLPNVAETKSFSRSCSLKAVCDDASTLLKGCKDAGGECSYKCCDKDLCNKVSQNTGTTKAPASNGQTKVPTTNGANAVPMVSTSLMLACAIVILYR